MKKQLLTSLFGLCALTAYASPDTIVINADVYTVDPILPRVEAFAIEQGKFSSLGSNEDILALADNDTHVIDAQGHTVTPGFIDAHQHFNGAQTSLNLYVDSHAKWAELIQKEHESLPKGAWMNGGGWDHTIIDDVLPTREFLDNIVGDRPTVLRHIDGHFVWVNTAVLELANITADTPVPEGGEIVLDPDTGKPTGILKESAMRLIRDLQPPLTVEQRAQNLPKLIHWANSIGITGMHNMSTHEEFLKVLETGDLNLRVWHGYFDVFNSMENLDERVKEVQALQNSIRRQVANTGKQKELGPLFDLGFVKLGNDGVLSVHTAVLLESYKDRNNWNGEWIRTPEDLKTKASAFAKGGFQIAIHSIGDAAVRASLDALEEANQYDVSLPHRIEHVELLNLEDLPRFADLNIVASMTPNHMTKAVAYIEERIEPKRESEAYLWQSLMNSGAKVIFGADASTSTHQDPLKQIGDAIFRTNHSGFNNGQPWHGEQSVTFAQALYAYTQGPASTTTWSDEIGSISVGKWADFVLIDGKISEPLTNDIYQRKVQMTYLAGREVYNANNDN
ncbi:MAG: amidohydrolase [Alteromonadaceae bacterium]|nr:amidohydrolase [Alteromonadaceae bacterium]